jgi:hypothetical protein
MKSRFVPTGFAIALLVVSHSAAADDAPVDPARKQFALGAAVGLGQFKSGSGIWTEIFFGHDVELSRSLELRAELAPLFFSYSNDETLNNVPGQPEFANTDDIRGFGALLRGALGYELLSRLLLRGGLVGGYARVEMDSTYCGTASLGNPFYGFSLEVAGRLGRERNLEAGIMLEMATLPLLRCADSAPPSTHRRDELAFDDPSLIGSAGVAYRF